MKILHEKIIHIQLKKKMKSFGLIYHGKQSLNVGSRDTICFFYIYCYMNYANIAWCSTFISNLKPCSQQRHVIRIIYNLEGR